MNKTQFTANDIKWIKNVNDAITNSAYLHPDPRIQKQFPFFNLEVKARNAPSVRKVPNGELILLYQYLDNQSVKCFTHLVAFVDDKIIYYPPDPVTKKVWCGRKAKIIAMTGNQSANSIPVCNTMWPSMNFPDTFYNLSWQGSYIREIPSHKQLPNLQQDIWKRFNPFMVKP